MLCKACFNPSLCGFHPIWVLGGGPQGARAQPAYAVFQPRQLENGTFQNCFFFYILTIQNDQISYVKHVLAPLYVFFTLFGCWGGGMYCKGCISFNFSIFFIIYTIYRKKKIHALTAKKNNSIFFIIYTTYRKKKLHAFTEKKLHD